MFRSCKTNPDYFCYICGCYTIAKVRQNMLSLIEDITNFSRNFEFVNWENWIIWRSQSYWRLLPFLCPVEGFTADNDDNDDSDEDNYDYDEDGHDVSALNRKEMATENKFNKSVIPK